jgi:putative peptidoglycan lipid II flippase
MKRFFDRANKRVSFGGAATLLIVVALLGQILGFYRNRLISANFTRIDPGATDAFFAAFQIPDFFFYTISAGALGVAFMPFLADHLERGDRKGMWQLVSSLMNLLLIVMLAVALVIFIFAEPLIHHIVAPKLTGQHLHDAVLIMRLIAINPLLFTLSGILTSVQQTFGRFFFYAVAPLFYNLSIIAGVYLFKHNIGVVGLGIGAVVGALLQLGIASFGLIGLGYTWRPKITWRSRDFHSILRQLPPRSLDQGIDSVNSIVETNRAQHLGVGAVTFYNFALTLANVPIALLGTSIATAAFPRLTERLAQNRTDLFRKEFLSVVRTMIWITMPVIVVCFFCRGYLARMLFGDVAPTVALLFGYLTIAIFFRIMYSIISRYFYAQKNTRTPLMVSIFAIILNIILAFTLARPSSYGIAGLAMAQSLVAFAEVAILLFIMLYKDRRLLNMAFWGAVGRIVSVTGFSLMAAFIMITLLPLKLSDAGFVTLAPKVGIISLVTFAVHLSLSSLFELEEAQPVVEKIKQIILKPIKIQ